MKIKLRKLESGSGNIELAQRLIILKRIKDYIGKEEKVLKAILDARDFNFFTDGEFKVYQKETKPKTFDIPGIVDSNFGFLKDIISISSEKVGKLDAKNSFLMSGFISVNPKETLTVAKVSKEDKVKYSI